MKNIIAKLRAYLVHAEGATTIEYGLLIGGISLVIVVVVFSIGTDLRNIFHPIDYQLKSTVGNDLIAIQPAG